MIYAKVNTYTYIYTKSYHFMEKSWRNLFL